MTVLTDSINNWPYYEKSHWYHWLWLITVNGELFPRQLLNFYNYLNWSITLMLQEAANTLSQKQTSQVVFLIGTQHAQLSIVDRYPCRLRWQKNNKKKAHHQKPKPNQPKKNTHKNPSIFSSQERKMPYLCICCHGTIKGKATMLFGEKSIRTEFSKFFYRRHNIWTSISMNLFGGNTYVCINWLTILCIQADVNRDILQSF